MKPGAGRSLGDPLVYRTVWASAGLLVLLGLAMLAVLVSGTVEFVRSHGLNASLLGMLYDPSAGRFGLLPFIAGSLVVTAIALVVAFPLALSVAVVVRQMSSSRIQTVRQVLSGLVAIPSVVFGWWGLGLIVPTIRALSGRPGFSLLAAGLVLAVMILPTLSLLSLNALARVPVPWVEGSLALGATPDQTLGRLILSVSRVALFEASILAVARALGETMAVQMVIGGRVLLPHSVLGPGATLTTQLLTDMSLLPPGVPGHHVLDFMALLLLGAMYGMVVLVERTRRMGP